MHRTLGQFVDIFKCCIFTWDFLPVVLPAFLLAGAIAAFIPAERILRYVGYRAKQVWAYLTACFSGFVISMCSCNIVPVALSIYRRGAGIGPAFAFLYAGPAINVVTLAWTFQVIGLKMGLWRTFAVPVIGIVIGLTMQFLFRGEEKARREHFASNDDDPPAEATTVAIESAKDVSLHHAMAVIVILLGILLLGAQGLPWSFRIPTLVLLTTALIIVLRQWFTADQVRMWLYETWDFMKMVLPIVIPALLVIAFIAWNIPIQWITKYLSHNSVRDTYIAAIFGSLMYFPILTEVAFAKAFLKQGMAVAPALAILLNGPGVSLPGALLLLKLFGWKKMLVYEFLEIVLGGAVALLFGKLYGDYTCPCQIGTMPPPNVALIIATLVMIFAALVVGYLLLPKRQQLPSQ